jgi:uncharacterized protein YbaP (TraB family)
MIAVVRSGLVSLALAAISICAVLSQNAAAAETEKSAAALPAAPALWRVSDDDSSLYLFGTIGMAPAGAKWRSRALAAAIDASETMWFEAPVADPAAQATANRIFESEGMLKGGALSTMLSPERSAALAGIAAAINTPLTSIDPLQPWAAFVVLSSQLYTGADVDPANGVDAALMKEADSRERSIRYLDTVENALGVLTKMSSAEQIQLVSYLIDDWSRQRDGAEAGFEAWRTGDDEASDAYLNAAFRAAAPGPYAKLVSGRAEALAGQIGRILEGPGTGFVALNASYMVGPDALPDLLAAKGFKVERITDKLRE